MKNFNTNNKKDEYWGNVNNFKFSSRLKTNRKKIVNRRNVLKRGLIWQWAKTDCSVWICNVRSLERAKRIREECFIFLYSFTYYWCFIVWVNWVGTCSNSTNQLLSHIWAKYGETEVVVLPFRRGKRHSCFWRRLYPHRWRQSSESNTTLDADRRPWGTPMTDGRTGAGRTQNPRRTRNLSGSAHSGTPLAYIGGAAIRSRESNRTVAAVVARSDYREFVPHRLEKTLPFYSLLLANRGFSSLRHHGFCLLHASKQPANFTI